MEASRIAAESTFSSQDEANCGTSLDPSCPTEMPRNTTNGDVSLYTLMQDFFKKVNCFSKDARVRLWNWGFSPS